MKILYTIKEKLFSQVTFVTEKSFDCYAEIYLNHNATSNISLTDRYNKETILFLYILFTVFTLISTTVFLLKPTFVFYRLRKKQIKKILLKAQNTHFDILNNINKVLILYVLSDVFEEGLYEERK